jgi:uncharacterized protein (TIRG00374 family)
VALLLSQIDAGDVMSILAKINPADLVIGFILYAISYFFRALRFHILLNKEVGIKELFSIVSVHNMALNIFPARSGELSYIYMLKKRHDKNIGEGAASLLAVRMFDIISISIIFFALALLAHDIPDFMVKAIPIVGLLLLFIVSILLTFMYQCSKFVANIRNISIYLKLNELEFIKYIFRKLDEMALCFERIHRSEFILSLLISLMLWLTLYSINYLLAFAMGINLQIESIFLASTILFMIWILPIQGIGGFGTFEGSWAVSFMAVGVAKEAAISSGFLMHIFGIFCLLILFIVGFILQPRK